MITSDAMNGRSIYCRWKAALLRVVSTTFNLVKREIFYMCYKASFLIEQYWGRKSVFVIEETICFEFLYLKYMGCMINLIMMVMCLICVF